jgi:hypothetical protein
VQRLVETLVGRATEELGVFCRSSGLFCCHYQDNKNSQGSVFDGNEKGKKRNDLRMTLQLIRKRRAVYPGAIEKVKDVPDSGPRQKDIERNELYFGFLIRI